MYIQYLVVLLDDASASYCHYAAATESHLIPLPLLKEGIRYAMKENLMVEFVYPSFALPDDILHAVDTIDSHKFIPVESPYHAQADVLLCEGTASFIDALLAADHADATYMLRLSKEHLFSEAEVLAQHFSQIKRLNIEITNIPDFTTDDFSRYKQVLSIFSDALLKEYAKDNHPQLNLLTDRMELSQMNNCDAGVKSITLAPDGKFYVCPAFYYDADESCVGSPSDGLQIVNPQLYQIAYAPLCRNCDAFHCHRCVWLNRCTTLEVNTPSHEQCVVAHIERNASRDLLAEMHKQKLISSGLKIPEIDYLDPFEIWDQIKSNIIDEENSRKSL